MSLKPSVNNPLLTELVQPSLPDGISWFPQSTGWQCVGFLFLGYLALLGYRWLKRYRADAYRRAALTELANIQQLDLIPQLIRRTALYAYPRAEVASLVDAEWEAWLDQRCPKSCFSSDFSGLLASLAYSPQSAFDAEYLGRFKAQAGYWLKHHEVNHD